MFLSKLMLNPLDQQARVHLSNPYELHCAVMTGFPKDLPPDERVLFRLEAPSRENPMGSTLLVQSQTHPNWETLAEKRRYLLNDPFVQEVPALVLFPGQLLRFRLRANPIKRSKETNQRVTWKKDEERLAWLIRKGEQAGFVPVPETVNIRKVGPATFEAEQAMPGVPGPKVRRDLTVIMIQFDGFLKVTDPAAFSVAIHNGIGPAKGFGCGLLSLARAA